jgi:Dolichyl-phosphate-mannose-protein mannosyltransferase
VDGLYRHDSEWFYRIAQWGYYQARMTNFFPMLPLLARLVTGVTGLHLRFALLVVANVASCVAYLLVYRIYVTLAGTQAARWALILLVSFPFAFFQAAAYPESLMMLCSALAVLLALRGNHIWAGVALGVGVLARHVTIVAGGALLVAQVRQRGLHPRRFLGSPALLGLIIPWVMLGGYCLFQQRTFGDPLAFYHARTNPIWGERAWWGLADLLATTARDVEVYVMYSYLPFALLPTLGAVMLMRDRQWYELASFAIVFMGLVWLIGMWGLGRYAASCWPAFLPLGTWLAQRPSLQGPVVSVLALFQGLYFYLFTQQFYIL